MNTKTATSGKMVYKERMMNSRDEDREKRMGGKIVRKLRKKRKEVKSKWREGRKQRKEKEL